MTIKRFFSLRAVALIWLTLMVFGLLARPAHAEDIAVQRVSLQADGSGWNLNASFSFGLNASLEDAINRGVPLYFTTSFTLTRPRWYWFDEQPVSVSRSVRLSFQPLTREYRISGVSNSGLQQSFTTLADALSVIRNIASWHVINRNQVEPGATYTAAVRMQLDTALMPKPFQINAVNNSDWDLSSRWNTFDFTVASRAR